jgi:ATP-dependent exoDNAse (exonuclease V) alpha subunit
VTLQKLLADPRLGEQLTQKSVIVLDEAGLVGLDDMQKLSSLAAKTSARVILSGDTGQHTGVPRGDALRLLEAHSLYRFVQLDQIRRQQAAAYRAIVELAAHGQPQAAFGRLEALGWVKEPANLYQSAAAAYLEALSQKKTALLIAPTWNEIALVTDCVRRQLKEKGLIGKKDEMVAAFDSFSWTDAQKRQPLHYTPGQRILFTQRCGLFRQNEELEVIAVSARAFRLRREDGTEHLFAPRTGTSFEVGERRQMPLCAGDQLLLQANRLTEGLANGQLVTVKAIQGGVITLTNGRTLPANYRQFTHGYCLTSHGAQGRTVDAVFLVASSRSAAAIHRQQFYVSISRARQSCRIFTDDKALLCERIARSTQRQAALELVRESLQDLVPPSVLPAPPKAPSRQPSTLFRALRPLPGLQHHRHEQRQRRVWSWHRMAQAAHAFLYSIGSWSKRGRGQAQQLAPEQVRQRPAPEVVKTMPPQEIKITRQQSRGRGMSL